MTEKSAVKLFCPRRLSLTKNIIVMKELLEKFIKAHRQYRGYNLKYYNIVDKSFSMGKGSAPLFRFYENEKAVIINLGLFNDSDKNKLQKFCEENGMESWEWKYAKLPKHCYDWPKALLPIEIFS